VCDLRNASNMVFSTKNMKNFLGRGHSPLPRPFPSEEGDTSSPHSTPSAPAAPQPLQF